MVTVLDAGGLTRNSHPDKVLPSRLTESLDEGQSPWAVMGKLTPNRANPLVTAPPLGSISSEKAPP